MKTLPLVMLVAALLLPSIALAQPKPATGAAADPRNELVKRLPGSKLEDFPSSRRSPASTSTRAAPTSCT
jgi:hypothetical protein